MIVLAIGCHPDDIEIASAGTLIKCAERGDRVTVCHVCNGNMGHVVIKPAELRGNPCQGSAEIRRSGWV